MKDFICFGGLNWLKSKVADRTDNIFGEFACKIKLARTNWNRKGQALSHFFFRPIIMFRSHTWNIHVSKNNSAVSGSFSRQLFIAKMAKLQNVLQGSSWKSDFSETIDWNCFVFSLDVSVGWCKVQQLDRKICTLQHTSKCCTHFFYKNNFYKNNEAKFAQKSRTITYSISLQVFLQFFNRNTEWAEKKIKTVLHIFKNETKTLIFLSSHSVFPTAKRPAVKRHG